MGDKIIITNIEVIQGGLLQIDIFNENTNIGDRIFVEPSYLFSKIGMALRKNHEQYKNERKGV